MSLPVQVATVLCVFFAVTIKRLDRFSCNLDSLGIFINHCNLLKQNSSTKTRLFQTLTDKLNYERNL